MPPAPLGRSARRLHLERRHCNRSFRRVLSPPAHRPSAMSLAARRPVRWNYGLASAAKLSLRQHKDCSFQHRNRSRPELTVKIRYERRWRRSIVIALLADGKGDGKPVAQRRERAGRGKRVGAKRSFKASENLVQLARLLVAARGGDAT